MKTNLSTAHAGEFVYWVRIKIRDTHTGAESELKWLDLPWPVRQKWDWYFKYRAALAQVQQPRAHVEYHWGTCAATARQAAVHRRNVVVARKRKITEITNKLAKAREVWTDIFPIEDNHHYQRAVTKLARLKDELVELEQELATELQNP